MPRKCPQCQNSYEDVKVIFCPQCKVMTQLIDDRTFFSKGTKSRINPGVYDDWDPPSPATLYCKIKNVPYNKFKHDRARGINPSKLGQIENWLEEHKYYCEGCSTYVEGFCTKKNKKVTRDSICKGFVPQY